MFNSQVDLQKRLFTVFSLSPWSLSGLFVIKNVLFSLGLSTMTMPILLMCQPIRVRNLSIHDGINFNYMKARIVEEQWDYYRFFSWKLQEYFRRNKLFLYCSLTCGVYMRDIAAYY